MALLPHGRRRGDGGYLTTGHGITPPPLGVGWRVMTPVPCPPSTALLTKPPLPAPGRGTGGEVNPLSPRTPPPSTPSTPARIEQQTPRARRPGGRRRSWRAG